MHFPLASRIFVPEGGSVSKLSEADIESDVQRGQSGTTTTPNPSPPPTLQACDSARRPSQSATLPKMTYTLPNVFVSTR